MDSHLYLGPTFDIQKYQKLEEEATLNFIADNQPEEPRWNFRFRDGGVKILAKTRKFMSWIMFSGRQSQHTEETTKEDEQGMQSESVESIVPVTTSRTVETVETGEETIPHYSHLPQSSLVPVYYSATSKTSIVRGLDRKRVKKLESFSIGTVPSRRFSDVDDRESEDSRLVAVSPNGDEFEPRLTSSHLQTSLSIDVTSEEGSEDSGYWDDIPHRFKHQLPEEEKKPMIEKGLVRRLTAALEPKFTGISNSQTPPALQMKSSRLTSSEGDDAEEIQILLTGSDIKTVIDTK